MSGTVDQLAAVGIFSDLPRSDLEQMAEGVEPVALSAGEVLFSEGDPGAHAYVILEGEVEVVKETEGREVLLAVRGPGDVIGEMALLDARPRSATLRGKSDAALLSIPKQRLDDVLRTSPTAARALFGVLLDRWRETEARLRQSERMAQLGTLTAGLAHELNNPAAAVKRSTDQLGEAVDRYARAVAGLQAAGIDPAAQDIDSVIRGEAGAPHLSALERSDAEEAVEDRLGELGLAEPWATAPALVEAGMAVADVERIIDHHGEHAGAVLDAIAAGSAAHGLLHQVQEGAGRLSAIVGALKSYSYLDQAPLQEIDVTAGLDDTLLILKHKIGDIEIVRDYSDDLPNIFAYASELNQVWTNLIDNAVDALSGAETPEPRLSIGALPAADGGVAVVIEDNGPGIPPAAQPRVFDAFFTTKAPGEGTGLGLDISYGIIVHKHGGDISFDSEPGRTVFRVELPSGKPEPTTADHSG